jgi:type I restriction enzyme, S subunit
MNWDDAEPPEGWILSTLGQAAQLVKEKVDPSSTPDARYVGLEHVEAETMRLLGSGRGSDVKSAKSKFSAGDVLYGKLRPYLNKVARPDFDGISSTDFLVFTESVDLDAGYLAHYLNQLWVANRAHHLSAGVELPRVDWKSLAQLPIAYPRSKSVQRGIVRKIATASASSTSATSHLDAARRSIERFRQAVLAAACSGRLTADWRDGAPSETMNILLERIASQRESILGSRHRKATPAANYYFGVPEGWVVTSLDSLSVRITSGSRDWSRFYGRGTGTFVMAQNVRRRYLDWSFRQAVDPPAGDKSRERSQIEVGDLLVTIVGANTGDVGPVTETRPEHYVCQSVALMRPVDAQFSSFLNLWFNSPEHGRGYFEECMYGAGRPHLSFDQLKAAPVAIPPLAEQQEISRRVDQLLSLADGLCQRLDLASRRLERSSQAVLAKAFRGELTLNGVARA